MTNSERAGVDIRVALVSGARPGAQVNLRGGAHATEHLVHAEPAGFKGKLKQLARRCARALFRVTKPVTRPLAFRLRGFLIGPLQLELEQLRQSIARERSVNRRWRESTDRLLTTHTEQLLHEIRTGRKPRALESSTPLPVRAEGKDGSAGFLGKLMRAENALVARIDTRRNSLEALQHASRLVSQQPDVVFLVTWAASSSSEEAGLASAAWLRFFEGSGLSFCAVHPETGELGPARLEQPDVAPLIELVVARTDSPIWQLAEVRR